MSADDKSKRICKRCKNSGYFDKDGRLVRCPCGVRPPKAGWE